MRQIAVSGPAALDVHRASALEWLVANGRGGFASGTVAGINTRRYHAILLAAPRMENRYVLLSQLQEEVFLHGRTWLLGATLYPGSTHPQGYQHIVRFTLYPTPTWVYAAGGWALEKRIAMPHGTDATIIKYRLLESPGGISLKLRPLIAGRDYHHTRRADENAFVQSSHDGDWIQVSSSHGIPDLWLAANGSYQVSGNWFRNIRYPEEEARGLDCEEDLYTPGDFTVELTPGEQAWFVAWSSRPEEPIPPQNPFTLVEQVISDTVLRHSELLDISGSPAGIAANLVIAADAYIISRGNGSSVIAGYPWFTDWGRDAMISLPGLFLATGRPREALSVLSTFAAAEQDGLIPNRFPDRSSQPEFNTVDAPLWFIYACYKYLKHTNDSEGLASIWPTIKAIIQGYRKGTRYGIGVNKNGLVRAGEEGCQLTWMDAKVGGWVVTPRQGYAVEINALWHNALRCVAHMAALYEPTFGEDCRVWAAQVRQNFVKDFWSPELGYLADVVRDDGSRDMSLRPNQLLAISLPYPVLRGDAARRVVRIAQDALYTPLGLRSLASVDPQYHGVYVGDQWQRDGAYHQGTVWAWLIGPFITAYRQAFGRTPYTRTVARVLIAPLLDHLYDAGLGHISEVFDANPPHTPRGCFAQAWSVAELLRLWAEEFDREPLEEIGKGKQVYHGY